MPAQSFVGLIRDWKKLHRIYLHKKLPGIEQRRPKWESKGIEKEGMPEAYRKKEEKRKKNPGCSWEEVRRSICQGSYCHEGDLKS